MSDTMKAAWIGVEAVLLAALISGVFVLISAKPSEPPAPTVNQTINNSFGTQTQVGGDALFEGLPVIEREEKP